MPTIDAVGATGVAIIDSNAQFQSIVDASVAANSSLYALRDSIVQQILPLSQQLNDVNNQIAITETDDVKMAKTAIRVLDMLNRLGPDAADRFF